MKRREPEEVGDVLRRVVRLSELERGLAQHQVAAVWERVAGPRLAPHTRGTLIGPGRLLIEARSAAWLHEATLVREQLRLATMRALPGLHVNEVRLRLGGDFPLAVKSDPARVTGPTASEAEVEAVRRDLERAGASDGAQLVARAAVLAGKQRRTRHRSG